MVNIKSSLVCTVLNEEESIGRFIDSIAKQTVFLSEIIIVDGGSIDNTKNIINYKQKQYKNKLNIKLFIKKGNRSIGRNEGIKQSTSDVILLTDSGCILDKNWVKEITKPFLDKKTEVVAGYYSGESKNIFQKSLIPYALVMQDKVNENNFLPATRSMAIRKKVWKKVGGFDENLSHNEDYAFANKLKDKSAKIVFAKKAIVKWIPRKNILQAFKMFFRFALGDVQANIFRDKVIYIFLRYVFAFYLLILALILKSIVLSILTVILCLGYILWSIKKNYKYVNDVKAFIHLPILQYASDLSVLTGTSLGLIKRFSVNSLVNLIIRNKLISIIIIGYILLMLSLIQWGIPNINHPFNYAMDEWHFSQALRTFIKYGTGSSSGAASIPLYHIISSIVFILPFYLLHLVNPLAIKNTLDNIPMQHILFIILRLHTLFYGILSIVLIFNYFKKFIKVFPILFSGLFIFTPIFISLTNYYKYDITLIFWIIATIYLLSKYYVNQKLSYFIFAGITLGLALSTKFTAAPLFFSYILGFVVLSKKISFKNLLFGIFISIIIFIFVGIPDLILGKGNYYQLLYSTLVQSPQASVDFNLGYPSWFFLLFKEFPSIFGYFLTITFYISFIFFTITLFRKFISRDISKHKLELFIYLSTLFFLISTLIFNIDGGGNRALVILPFMVLLSGLFIQFTYIQQKFIFRKILLLVIFLGLFLQIIQSLSFLSVKFYKDPREASSVWILNNISKNKTIGIENIPIYQMLPDYILKDYYQKQHNREFSTRYNYQVLNTYNQLPEYVIVTNDFDDVSYIKNSAKKDLVFALKTNNYKVIKRFSPNLKFYNIFADKIYFMVANIIPMPVTISIYEK